MEKAKQAVEAVAGNVKKVAVGKPKEKKEKKAAPAATAGPSLSELSPRPKFIDDRLVMFDELKKKQDEEIAKKPRSPIVITMPDGSNRPGTAWETTPAEIALSVSKSLYKRACVAKVHAKGESVLWDLERPLEEDCKLEILDFNHPEGKQVFWHSVSHHGTATPRCRYLADTREDRAHTALVKLANGCTDVSSREALPPRADSTTTCPYRMTDLSMRPIGSQ